MQYKSTRHLPYEAVAAVVQCVHADSRDKERRAKSVVVSGLIHRHDVTDAASFRQLCSQEFGLYRVITYAKRLGAGIGDRAQPLLIGLQSPDEASEWARECMDNAFGREVTKGCCLSSLLYNIYESTVTLWLGRPTEIHKLHQGWWCVNK